MELSIAFGQALKKVRSSRNLTQEDFSTVSSRTYLSSLERGLKSPTLEKIDQIAGALLEQSENELEALRAAIETKERSESQ